LSPVGLGWRGLSANLTRTRLLGGGLVRMIQGLAMTTGPEPAGNTSSPAPADRGKAPGDHDKAPPPAGPHADPALVNPELTPGAGTLPAAGPGEDVESPTD